MPPSTRSTDPPSIHPPAAFSCSQAEAGAGVLRQLRSQIRPPSNHGRSVGTLAHTRFLLRAARGKEKEEGRCAAHARKPCARTLLFPPSFLPSPQVALGPSAVARYTIPQVSSPTPLAPSFARSAGCRSIIIIASALPPAARIWHRQMNSYSPSPSPRHRNGDRR